MTSVRAERPGRVVPALLFVVGALLVALLVYGVLRQAPDSTIDDTLAAGRQIPARSFALEVLAHTGHRSRPPRPGSRGTQRW